MAPCARSQVVTGQRAAVGMKPPGIAHNRLIPSSVGSDELFAAEIGCRIAEAAGARYAQATWISRIIRRSIEAK